MIKRYMRYDINNIPIIKYLMISPATIEFDIISKWLHCDFDLEWLKLYIELLINKLTVLYCLLTFA